MRKFKTLTACMLLCFGCALSTARAETPRAADGEVQRIRDLLQKVTPETVRTRDADASAPITFGDYVQRLTFLTLQEALSRAELGQLTEDPIFQKVSGDLTVQTELENAVARAVAGHDLTRLVVGRESLAEALKVEEVQLAIADIAYNEVLVDRRVQLELVAITVHELLNVSAESIVVANSRPDEDTLAAWKALAGLMSFDPTPQPWQSVFGFNPHPEPPPKGLPAIIQDLGR